MSTRLVEILADALAEKKMDRQAIIRLLSVQGREREELFACARELRCRYFGTAVYMYGFIYMSTYCRNNCLFCQYRVSNHTMARYRKTKAQILAAGRCLAQEGVHLLDLTLGEDPYFLKEEGFHELLESVRALKEDTGLPLMLSPGVISNIQMTRAAEAGVDWYACYQETHNPDLFAHLREGQRFHERLTCKRQAAALGLCTEEGILTGVGASLEDAADSLMIMMANPFSQVRAMTYAPHALTMPADKRKKDEPDELCLLATMRLCMPKRLIPASLDVDGLEGLRARLQAGANVVTSLVPSGQGLAGVASAHLDIDNNRRSVAAVKGVLAATGLHPATARDYRDWLAREQWKRPEHGAAAMGGA